MSVSELTFKYAVSGAKKAQRADRQVRESIQTTAKTAKQESGRVERWMTQNKRAIQAVGVASAAAIGSVLASSSRMQAELSGVRSAFGLLADTIVSDLLPNTGSLATAAINAVQAYRDMDGGIRRVVSAIGAFVAGVLALLPIIATLVGSVSTIVSAAGSLSGVFATVASVASTVAGAIAAVVGAVSATAAALAIAVAAVVAFAAAYLTNFRGVRDKTNQFIGDMIAFYTQLGKRGWNLIKDHVNRMIGIYSDFVGRAAGWGKSLVMDFVNAIKSRVTRARSAAASVRDRIVNRLSTIADGAREWGRSIVDGIVDGLTGRLSALRNAAEEVAQTVRDYLPSSPAKKGPLSSLDKVRGAIPRTLQEGLNEGVGNVTGTLNTAPRGGGQGGGRTVNVETVEIVIQGSGNPRRDGRNAAEEVAEQFERNLGGRGV